MKEMSISRQRATELVAAYNRSLEEQLVGRGSSLVCQDEELWKQVEGLLRDGDAQEMHCLGLDPLSTMEESLSAAATAARAGRAKTKGGLQGLAKAFEIMEQAALNLYLSPWREEYKVVKMYSGTFTHHIKPVLSMQQIEKLFGLLGYKFSSSRHEQLRLQSLRVGPAYFSDILRLSCAFFLARCECRLLLTSLGKYVGVAQWELCMVRERQRGNSLQVALDNTKKKLEVNQPQFTEELELDLYTDEQVNGGQRGAVINDHKSSRSLTWVTQSSASTATVKTHSNGGTSLSSSSTSPPTREDVHVSTLNCQLTQTSALEMDTIRSSASIKQGQHPCEESMFDKADLQSHNLQVEGSLAEDNHFCSCLHSRPIRLKHCTQCNTLHDFTCASLEHCKMEGHCVVFSHVTTEEMKESRAASPQGGSLRVGAMSVSQDLASSSAAMSSLVICDDLKSVIPSIILPPIGYHNCCDLTQLDPQFLCFTCGVFHSGSCSGIEVCQMHHNIKPLGVCSCGRTCSRNPLVLCRYCGNEYCTSCWYRNPVVCTCGQTFDQSSSV